MDGKRESYKWELLALLCLAFFFNQATGRSSALFFLQLKASCS
jgi:hypothetical protein